MELESNYIAGQNNLANTDSETKCEQLVVSGALLRTTRCFNVFLTRFVQCGTECANLIAIARQRIARTCGCGGV